MKRATHKQTQILDELDSSMAGKGFPPTFTEIGRTLGITVGTVRRHLLALRRKGLVDWDEREKRTLRRTDGNI